MNPNQRLSWTLVLSLVIWTPIAISMLNGGIEFWIGGLYYACALVFSHIGTGVIQRLVNSYRSTQDAVEHAKEQIEEIEKRNHEDETPRRRSTDAIVEDETSEEAQAS